MFIWGTAESMCGGFLRAIVICHSRGVMCSQEAGCKGGACAPQAVRQRISDLLSEEEKIDGLENVEVKVFK